MRYIWPLQKYICVNNLQQVSIRQIVRHNISYFLWCAKANDLPPLPHLVIWVSVVDSSESHSGWLLLIFSLSSYHLMGVWRIDGILLLHLNLRSSSDCSNQAVLGWPALIDCWDGNACVLLLSNVLINLLSTLSLPLCLASSVFDMILGPLCWELPTLPTSNVVKYVIGSNGNFKKYLQLLCCKITHEVEEDLRFR